MLSSCRRTRRGGHTLIALALGIALIGACTSNSTDQVGERPRSVEQPRPTDLDVPAGARPGDVIEVVDQQPPDELDDVTVRALSYVTTTIDGSLTSAVTLLIVPPDAPEEPPIVVWGHPTRGLADRCAPSLHGAGTVAELAELVAQGWVVVAPDMAGLGAPGRHLYLVGDAQARSLLDAARAVTRIDGAGIAPGGPVALWGFSQGGHAVAFAAQRAASYAPELDIVGVAIAAPVSDVVHFAERAEAQDDQFGVLVTILAAYEAAYPDVDPPSVLTPEAMQRYPIVDRECIGEVVEEFDHPVSEQLAMPLARADAFGARMRENRAGDEAIELPALIVQGGRDDIIDPDDSLALAERWCALGVAVTWVLRAEDDHGVDVDGIVVPWLAQVLDGDAPTSDCEALRAG